MKALIGLELRKQGKTFLGLLLIIAFCLTIVTASVSTFAGLPADESFLSITVMLQAFGVPFFALLLAGSAGSSLRNSKRHAEEEIPIRPSKRILAAYITSMIYLIVLAAVLFAASTPMRYSATLQQEFDVPLMMVILLPLHSAAFVFSYWLSQALLASVISTIITSLPAYWLFMSDSLCSTSFQVIPEFLISILALILFPFWILGGMESILVFFNAIPGIIATFIHLSLLIWLANRFEREKRILYTMKAAITAVLLISFSIRLWGMFALFPFQKISQTDEFSQRSITSCPYVNP